MKLLKLRYLIAPISYIYKQIYEFIRRPEVPLAEIPKIKQPTPLKIRIPPDSHAL